MSWISVAGWYSAIRCTTAAAVTSALSVLYGWLPWPGVPDTRSWAQWLPFSATITGSFRPVGLGIGMPPDSVIT